MLIYLTNIVEATTGEASLTGISSIVAMLADASLTRSLSGDEFRKIFVEEIKCYERGEGPLL